MSDAPRARIRELVASEMAEAPAGDAAARRSLEDFRASLVEPQEVAVQFSGGTVHTCWTVTQSDGDYRVVFVPAAGVFALCVESAFGPLDIGVHGDAIGCFTSV